MVSDRLINQSSSIVNFSLGLLFLFPVLPNALQSSVFALFLLTTLWHGFLSKPSFRFSLLNWKNYLLLVAYYACYLISFFKAPPAQPMRFELVQANLLLFLAPTILFFASYPFDFKNKSQLVLIFTVTNILLIGLLLQYWIDGIHLCYHYLKGTTTDFKNYEKVNIITYIFSNSSGYIQSIAEWGYYKHSQVKELNTHHTYISAVINLNIILLISVIHQLKSNYLKILSGGIALFFIAYVLYMESKLNIAFLAISLLLYGTITLYRSNRIYSLIVLVLLAGSVFMNKEKIAARFDHFSIPTSEIGRMRLYVDLAPLVVRNFNCGVGANNVIDSVDYITKNDPTSFVTDFYEWVNLKHTHSQYLYYQLSGGILNSTLFVLMFVSLFFFFIKNRDIFGFLFVLLISINCIFEDFLNRAWGVYTFILGLIFFLNYSYFRKNER